MDEQLKSWSNFRQYAQYTVIIFMYKYRDNEENRLRGRVNQVAGWRSGTISPELIPTDQHPQSRKPEDHLVRYYDTGKAQWRSFDKQCFIVIASFLTKDKSEFVESFEETGFTLQHNKTLQFEYDVEGGTDEERSRRAKTIEKDEVKREDQIQRQRRKDMLQKGGQPAFIGEQRMFSGRLFVKTNDGWKYLGKGKGSKAQSHIQKHSTTAIETKGNNNHTTTKGGIELSIISAKQWEDLKQCVSDEYGYDIEPEEVEKMSPEKFNDGLCDVFAEKMIEWNDEYEYFSTDDFEEDFRKKFDLKNSRIEPHAFIGKKVEGKMKYFDIENQQGVDDAADLPIYKRSFNKQTHVSKNIDIFQLEDSIKNQTYESCGVYNGESLVFKKDGQKSEIVFEPLEMQHFKGATFTHNHPNGKSFSYSDLMLAFSSGLKEIRVVSSKIKYQLVIPETLEIAGKQVHKGSMKNGILSTSKQLHDRFYKIERELKTTLLNKIIKGELTTKQAEQQHHHELMLRFVKDTNLTYNTYEKA